MARVYPQPAAVEGSPSEQREVFTIWMKSLVLNGSGCAVYDSGGRLAYRVDNYDSKRDDELFLMDLGGRVLFKILRKKKLGLFGRWEGYRCTGSQQQEELTPSFRMVRPSGIFTGDGPREVTVFGSGDSCRYRIEGAVRKSRYKITGVGGELIAELERKRAASGVALGDDVLAMVVEPHSDLSLVMALMVVCSRISHTM
ncbi:unnamed protein product [Spirodela intermedia]|uniref:Uncharacterized protein n=1 Tax=Spirodela intermedia TaxID=51605 RepID=A0A7I8JZD4_SPIIN|nr:unnamed protein product [Spirodela intermedia]